MDTSRNDQLGELAAGASAQRADFMAAAAAQLRKFLDANADRIAGLGGLVLIDDDVDHLTLEADLTFRSRSHYVDEATGKWVTETEVIESAENLVELYNLADIFGAFQDAAKEDAGEGEEPAAEQVAGLGNPYAAVADDWAAGGRESEAPPENEEEAAERLYDLALAFQERSQQTEAHLLEQFESAAAQLAAVLGDLIVVDDDDERLTLRASGAFEAEVVPETEAESGIWRKLDSPEDIVEFYDPTDVFGDLADTLAEAFPALGEPLGGLGNGYEGAEGEDEGEDDGPEDAAGEEEGEAGQEGDEPR
jgi:hypothetical protein